MENLIITVACDGWSVFPNIAKYPNPTDKVAVAKEYIRSVNAGATIMHLHGSYTVDENRKRLHDIEGWGKIRDYIVERFNPSPVIQFGVASMEKEERFRLWELRPDMSSVCFNAHDEYFDLDPSVPPRLVQSLHPLSQLKEYSKEANKLGIKIEIEAFHTGAFWNINKLIEDNLLPLPPWVTLFIGWPGGSWTPPTFPALQNMVDHLPAESNYSVSCKDSEMYWRIISHTIALGGHVRVGMEDCPYLEDGTVAESNAQLVEKTVRIAHELGRKVASIEETKKIIKL